jgi:hypothetical protein
MRTARDPGWRGTAPDLAGATRVSLRQRLRRALMWAGVDRAIAVSIAGRGWSLIASPVTLLLIGTHLSKQEQGYYYTFTNVLGLSVLFELGLSYVVGLIASHERAHVTWNATGELEGPSGALARLGSLLVGSVRWYGAVAILIVAVVLPTGFFFFGHDASAAELSIAWKGPWLWVAIATALACLMTPIWAIIQGLGAVVETAQVRLSQQVGGSVLVWCGLLLGWKLCAAPLASTFTVIYGLYWLSTRRRRLLGGLWKQGGSGAAVNWKSEVWTLQWRIALGWFGAWWMFQTLAPLSLFRFQGSIVAGQMGMSLTVSQALSPMGAAWIATKTPAMGTLVARREFKELDRVFFRALVQSTVLMVMAGLGIIGVVVLLNAVRHPFAGRMLTVGPMACLVGAATANHVVTSLALYLRSHKQEPLAWLSAVLGLSTAASALALARFATVGAMCATYLALTAGVNLIVTWRVFTAKRRAWHA